MALLEDPNPFGRVPEREPARIGVGLGVQRHFAHGIQFGRERGPRLDFAFEVRVRDIPRQRQLHQFLFEGLDARVRFVEVGGSDLGSMPDRRGHALGVGERASGVRGGFFRLRETLLELELALGLRGFVLLARRVQLGLRLLAGRVQVGLPPARARPASSRAAASSAFARAEADAPSACSVAASHSFCRMGANAGSSPVASQRAFERGEPGADQVAKRVQFLARRTLDLGGNGIDRCLGLGLQRTLSNRRLGHSWRGRSKPTLGASVMPS